MLNTIFPKIHKEGYKFLAISVLITFIALFLSKLLGLIFIIISIWIYYFFRDPERFSINDDSYLVSKIVSKIVNEKTSMGVCIKTADLYTS